MGMYSVQQKVVTWQAKFVEADSIEQAVALAVELDDWQGMYDCDEALDTFYVASDETSEADIYSYDPTGKLIKEQN